MRSYELAYIIRPTENGEGVTGVVEKVKGFILTNNGEVASVDVWGRRVLAYPIEKFREGTYVLVQAKMPPAALAEIERNLKLSEEIIRYQLFKVD